MAKRFDPAALMSPGVVVKIVDETGTGVMITVRSPAVEGKCPACRCSSRRIHSRYTRTLAYLPLSGTPVQLTKAPRRIRPPRTAE